MYEVLDDESYSIDDRLKTAKIMLQARDLQIDELILKLEKVKSAQGWIQEELSNRTMGYWDNSGE